MTKRISVCLLTIISFFSIHGCWALDNPDAPDYLAAIEGKEKPFLEQIENVEGYRETLIAYNEYHVFLESEINSLNQQLNQKLPNSKKVLLINSQKQWIEFKESEFELIDEVWDRNLSGSSSAMVRGKYKAKILRARVLELIGYMKSF